MTEYNIYVDVNYYENIPDEYPINSFISKETDELYKKQFLEAINENIYNEEVITAKLEFLHSILKDTKLNIIMDKLCKCVSYDLTDNKIGYYLLFSFDFFYITHILLCHYFVHNEIQEEIYNVLNDKIECLIKNN